MRIIFGWNSFLLKSITNTDLGIPENETSRFTIEIRQFYFHLFWIPFFGIGKRCLIRKDDELYPMPSEYQVLVDEIKQNVKTPWYTFTGPLLLFLAYIMYLGYNKYDDYRDYQNDVKWIEEKANKINNPLKNDYYTLISEESKSYIIQVFKSTKDSIEFKVAQKVQSSDDMSKLCTQSYYLDTNNVVQYIWISKKTLLNCCAKKPEDFYDFNGNYIDELLSLTEQKVLIDRVDRD